MKRCYLKCFIVETSDDSVEIEVPFKVGMWDLKQCDPKRCTGRKLMRLEMIDKLGMFAMFNGIVLTPVATEVILINNLVIIKDIYIHNINVIECFCKRQ